MATGGAAELDIGHVVADTYEVQGLLGRGGMGAVWAVSHRRLPGKRFAIKVLLGDGASNPEIYARFQREAEIASRLGHPNIVEVIDFNVLPSGAPYIVMEFLRGESLAGRLRRAGRLELDKTLDIARQVASALSAAHRANVVHRDLKPDNIFLVPPTEDGTTAERAKVLDFGISKIRDSSTIQTQTSTVIGTPQYMAPEQAAGKHREIDGRTDEFALAAIVYEMLSGQPPFAGETLAEIVCKVMLEEPAPLESLVPALPAAVSRAVHQGLSKAPSARFPDVASFIAALSGRPLTAPARAVASSEPGLAATLALSDVGTSETLLATPTPSGPTPAVTPAPTPAATPAPTPAATPAPATGRSLMLLAITLGVGASALGLGAWLLWASRHPAPPVTEVEPPAAAGPSAAPSTKPEPATPSPAPAPSPAPSPSPPEPVVAPPPAAHSPPRRRPPGAGTHSASIERVLASAPAHARPWIEGARRALDENDNAAADELGRRLMRIPETRDFGFFVRAVTACRAGDVGAVQAAKPHVPPAYAGQVARECAQTGTNF